MGKREREIGKKGIRDYLNLQKKALQFPSCVYWDDVFGCSTISCQLIIRSEGNMGTWGRERGGWNHFQIIIFYGTTKDGKR